ncbi:MAG: DUF4394 domain-containing protein [Armatimonadetes bacterium]|nr:DUF4394 domain-containing protein [Armatimonadota bacterium]CUU36653.1 PEP-CTERM protein-sorting domain-containing protein [Armatimonadetes bacterium DC]
MKNRWMTWLTGCVCALSLTSVARVEAQLTYGVTVDNRLIAFDAMNPTALTQNVPISGLLQQNELILGIDFRPRTGELYALGSSNRLYKLNPMTGMAMPVGSGMPFSPPLSGVEFGFDFNPVVDRIRLTSDNRQNLRLHPDTGQVVAVDGPLTYNSGDPNFGRTPHIVGSAYTNNFDGATSTVLYNIDSNLDILVIQNPPNPGGLITVGSLGMDISSLVGFDIATFGTRDVGYLAITRAGDFRSWLATIDLNTGMLSPVAPIGGTALLVRDIAVVPEPASMLALGTGLVSLLALRRRKR